MAKRKKPVKKYSSKQIIAFCVSRYGSDHPVTEDAIAVLTVRDAGIFTVDVKLNGEFGDEVWLQQSGKTKNRYVGFDNSKPINTLGTRLSI